MSSHKSHGRGTLMPTNRHYPAPDTAAAAAKGALFLEAVWLDPLEAGPSCRVSFCRTGVMQAVDPNHAARRAESLVTMPSFRARRDKLHRGLAPRRLLRPVLSWLPIRPPLMWSSPTDQGQCAHPLGVAHMLHRQFIVMPRRDVIEILTKCHVLCL